MRGGDRVRQTVIVLVCDRCQTERQTAKIAPRQVALDSKPVEVDLCARCWDDLREPFAAVLGAARKVEPPPARASRKGAKVTTVATSEQGGWLWTAHALTRLGERQLDAADVIRAAADPQSTRPSERLPEAKVHSRDGVKAVVIPQRRVIITCAREAADLDVEAAVG